MVNFYFKNIEISNLHDILNEFKRSIDFDRYSEPFSYANLDFLDSCDSFRNWCNRNNLQVRKAAVIISNQKLNNSLPHVDSQANCLALNFPIQNCDNSYTEFYKIPENSLIITKQNGEVLSKSIVSNSFGECVAKYHLKNAVLINTHQPHKVVCLNPNHRICLSFRFTKDPWHLIDEADTFLTN